MTKYCIKYQDSEEWDGTSCTFLFCTILVLFNTKIHHSSSLVGNLRLVIEMIKFMTGQLILKIEFENSFRNLYLNGELF